MRNNKQALLSLALAGILHGMIHTLSLYLSPLNAEIARYFGLETISGVTAFKTSYLIVYAGSNLFFGALTNRMRARIVLSIGMTVNALAVIAFRFVPPSGVPLMHLLWIIAAVGGGVYHPVANVLITRLFPDRKGWAFGITGMGAGMGFAFGPLLTGSLSAFLNLDWQEISLVFGGIGLACGAAAFLGIRDVPDGAVRPGGEPNLPATEPQPEKVPGRGKALFGLPLGLWGFLVFIILVAGTRDFTMWSILDISDFYLNRVFSGTASTAWYLFVMYLPGIFTQPLAGALSDRVGRKKLTTILLLLYGLSIISLAFLPKELLLLSYFIIGAAQSSSNPIIEALVADFTTPKTRGLIYGIYITAIMGIGALGPLLAGLYLDGLGRTLAAFQSWMFLLGGLVMVGGLAMIASGRLIAFFGLPTHGTAGK
jgi:FSR family fosmidomycin resistance protein-like MFS transporter